MKRQINSSPNVYLCVSVPFFTFCFIGLLLHAYFYTAQYLRYATLSDVNLRQNAFIEAPTLAVCFFVSSLIKGKDVHHGISEIQEVLEKYTLEQIFSAVPPSDKILVYCTIRTNDTFQTIRHQGSCLEYFKINKIFRLGFLCYSFQVKESARVSSMMELRPVLTAQNSPGILYGIEISGDIARYVDYFNLFTYFKDFPIAQDTYLAHFSRQPMKLHMFYLSYNIKSSNLLPSPYDSNCLVYQDLGFRGRSQCFQVCVIRKLRLSNHSLTIELTVDEQMMQGLKIGKMKYSALELEKDKTFTKQYDEIEDQCWRSCLRPDCYSSYYITHGITSTQHARFMIVLHSPSEHLLEAKKRPEIDLTQYLNDVVSFFSIWFGLSVLGLAKVIKMLKPASSYARD